jgi:CheY-like chemotaxis protein
MTTNILVVDDAEVERLLVEGVLSKNPAYRVKSAANGKDALKKIKRNPPDLVLTDLVMPEMDGVELVRAMRLRYPEIPIILMTAFGDEATAVEAFEAGAASYVPKARRAERLVETVTRVLEHAKAGQNRERLSRSMLEYHGRFALENDPALIRALVDQIEGRMAGIGFADAVERIRIGEAVEEALLNAMYHGNLEITRHELDAIRAELDDALLHRMIRERCRDPRIGDRRILAVVHVTESDVRFVIRDEGCGFNRMFEAPEDTTGSFDSGRHRGFTLIRSLMDEVKFNEAGNELILHKTNRRPSEASHDPTDVPR